MCLIRLSFVFFLTLSLCILVISHSEEDRMEEWVHFKEKYGKKYSTEDEEKVRQEIFFRRLETIDRHNLLYQQGSKSYKMAVNKYSDLTNDEFKKKFTSRFGKEHSKEHLKVNRGKGFLGHYFAQNTLFPPQTYDLRKILGKKMPPVRDQANCGSCWAISPVAAIEMFTALVKNISIHYSVQQVLDCTYKVDKESLGCDGGFPESALDFILKFGIESELDYPTFNYPHPCRMRSPQKTIVQGYRYLSSDESKLHFAVSQGPIITEIYASSDTLLGYHSGIIDDVTCSDEIDHVAVIIGYDNQSWILQNSWGSDWGEDGYFRIKRGAHMCGVALDSIQLYTSSSASALINLTSSPFKFTLTIFSIVLTSIIRLLNL